MTIARKALRITIHAVIFVAALAIFWFGLVMGLTVNPTLGTFLWLCSVAITGLNLFWMFRKRWR